MVIHHGRIVLCALAMLAFGQTAGAQTPSPAPAPAATPAAFSARAHADVTVVGPDRTMTGSVQFGVAQRANLTRIDVLSVKSDTLPIPPVTLTAVIDRRANTVAVWNDTTKLYHVQSLLPRSMPSSTPKSSPKPTAGGSPAPAQQGGSPFSKLDVLALTIKLTGHTTTSGVPTTGLSLDFQVAKKGETVPSHVTATAQLADEYAAFPMTLDVAVEPGGATPFKANLTYAVDELTRGAPPAARFAIPRGYADAGSLVGVIFPRSRSGGPAKKSPASSRPER